jgi:glyoxylase-like metal-dependent hydrolase (beta-lactamase superfamily II)
MVRRMSTLARPSPAPAVLELGEHLTAFYVGRGLTDESPLADVPDNWVDGGAWALGAAVYALHADGRALVYDTGTLPDMGRWIREYLRDEKGAEDVLVVLSHWHLDHVAGNSAFPASRIIALEATRDALAERRAQIEAGELWGPPGFELVLPGITFRDRLTVHLGELRVEFLQYRIHSRDSNLMYLSAEQTLFPGDTLEDTVTYVVDPGDIPLHIEELSRLRELDVARIYPNHGNPSVIADGGYGKDLIDAMVEYNCSVLARLGDPGYLDLPVEEFVPDALAAGTVTLWEAYRGVHRRNLEVVREHWGASPPDGTGKQMDQTTPDW